MKAFDECVNGYWGSLEALGSYCAQQARLGNRSAYIECQSLRNGERSHISGDGRDTYATRRSTNEVLMHLRAEGFTVKPVEGFEHYLLEVKGWAL